ncbi:MAG: hypothetical protein C4310_04340 [Chloroflexota bacterium]
MASARWGAIIWPVSLTYVASRKARSSAPLTSPLASWNCSASSPGSSPSPSGCSATSSLALYLSSCLAGWCRRLIVYLLEIFVGAIQAFVFMMLTVVFIHLATISHGGEAHEGTRAPAAHGETA